jgi:hypothetical protein
MPRPGADGLHALHARLLGKRGRGLGIEKFQNVKTRRAPTEGWSVAILSHKPAISARDLAHTPQLPNNAGEISNFTACR